MQTILAVIQEIKPTRVVIDSLSEFRLLAQNSLRYRRQILALKQFFSGRNCTVLLLDDRTAEGGDLQLQSVVHGVLDAGASLARIRRRSSPDAHGKAARARLSRRVSRLRHRARGTASVSFAGRGTIVRRRRTRDNSKAVLPNSIRSSGVGSSSGRAFWSRGRPDVGSRRWHCSTPGRRRRGAANVR